MDRPGTREILAMITAKSAQPSRKASTGYLQPINEGKNRNATPVPLAYALALAGGLLHAKEFFAMCDYSLHSVRSRPAKVGDKLVTRDFGTGTRGFASVTDINTAVCLLPGTELAFAGEVSYADWNIRSLIKARLAVRIETEHRTAIFRQVNKETITHHDALELPDGQVVLLTRLSEGQEATVLQLPAEPRGAEEPRKQERRPVVA
jgi:hypothetical protein